VKSRKAGSDLPIAQVIASLERRAIDLSPEPSPFTQPDAFPSCMRNTRADVASARDDVVTKSTYATDPTDLRAFAIFAQRSIRPRPFHRPATTGDLPRARGDRCVPVCVSMKMLSSRVGQRPPFVFMCVGADRSTLRSS
jgi:hypothetical protein